MRIKKLPRTVIIEVYHTHYGCPHHEEWEYRVINSVYCATAFSKKRYINMNYVWDNFFKWKHPETQHFKGELLDWSIDKHTYFGKQNT